MPERERTSIKLVEAVTAPLGFFVLALLIVESFLAAALVGGGLGGESQIAVLWMGVSMFVLVIAVVAVLVWQKPENLTFDKQAHLDLNHAQLGTETQTVERRDALLPTMSTEVDQ